MTESETSSRLSPTESAERIRKALKSICESDLFVNADRLTAFLTYVVEEAIAGRGDLILGKTIAQDVYLRKLTGPDTRNNLVRVDAGRLRRKLTQYYDTSGRDDPVRIHIDSGGYAPWFEDRSAPAISPPAGPAMPPPHRSGRWRTVLIAALGACLALAILWVVDQRPEPASQPSSRNAELKALASKSTATVQAENLCSTARAILFPLVNIDNQRLASDIFRQAIKTDQNYHCGYAGLAHSLSTSALLTPPGAARTAFVDEALEMARKTVDMAPMNGWSQSALAWAHYAGGEHAKALDLSKTAVDLSLTDGNVLDFRAVTLLVLGQFQGAYDISSPDRPRDRGSHRFAHRNVHAVASFHLGKYQETIDSLTYAAENGDPVSELTLVFLAAAHQGLGNTAEARENLDRLRQSWPEFRPLRVLRAFYSDPELAEPTMENLRAAGWVTKD